MERSLRFITSILCKYPNLRGASTIKGRIQNRMNTWNEEKVSAVSFSVVKDTEATMGRREARQFKCEIEGESVSHCAL